MLEEEEEAENKPNKEEEEEEEEETTKRNFPFSIFDADFTKRNSRFSIGGNSFPNENHEATPVKSTRRIRIRREKLGRSSPWFASRGRSVRPGVAVLGNLKRRSRTTDSYLLK